MPWIDLKVFKMQEAVCKGVTENAITMQIKRGKYPGLITRRWNSRVIEVFTPYEGKKIQHRGTDHQSD